jgi:UDP-N-acetylmuramoylalanine--D-glutamate ligase
MAAVHAIQTPRGLLLGGRDKDLPWGDLAGLLRARRPKVILFGEAGDLIRAALLKDGVNYPLDQVSNLEEAVKKADQIAVAGESVLLSPGGTSFDAFRDFEERGECFRRLVKELP